MSPLQMVGLITVGLIMVGLLLPPPPPSHASFSSHQTYEGRIRTPELSPHTHSHAISTQPPSYLLPKIHNTSLARAGNLQSLFYGMTLQSFLLSLSFSLLVKVSLWATCTGGCSNTFFLTTIGLQIIQQLTSTTYQGAAKYITKINYEFQDCKLNVGAVKAKVFSHSKYLSYLTCDKFQSLIIQNNM